MKSDNYNRMGFKEEKKDVEQMMVTEFTSPLIAELRANKGVLTRGDVTIKLAEFYGFCWGVERAVSHNEIVKANLRVFSYTPFQPSLLKLCRRPFRLQWRMKLDLTSPTGRCT